ncbi:hypothetical protein Tco_1028804 [Tanacetum coccineum]|uniref:DUF4283 domain-containing protein n=1 Tax=Tanacetum coccineum TaxID=301880 RepID=A0ABQ5G349_9ASTR
MVSHHLLRRLMRLTRMVSHHLLRLRLRTVLVYKMFGIKGFYNFVLLVQLSTAMRRLSTVKLLRSVKKRSTQEENSVKAGHDNQHDVNVRETPSNFTTNLNKGTSYANLFTGESTKKALIFALYLHRGETELMCLFQWSLLELLVNGLLIRRMVSFRESGWLIPFSIDSLDSVIENGLWFIRNNLLILKKWNLDDGLSVIATKLGTPLMLESYTSDMCIQSHGRSSYARAFIEVRADVELKDIIVVAMPKLVGDIRRLGYGPNPVDDCPRIIDSNVVKNMKNPSQTTRGVLVGPKKKDAKPTIEISNSNLFDVLNLVENNVDSGTNGGTSNMAIKKANSSGSSLIIDEKIILVDDEGKPLTNVDYSGDHDSEVEVASVDNNMANFLASKKVGYGTNSLLEQWKESYVNSDYNFDPYDDGMYEGQNILDKIQDICDNLDIKV